MKNVQFIWLIILSVLYAVLIEFQVDTQKQLNSLNERLESFKKQKQEHSGIIHGPNCGWYEDGVFHCVCKQQKHK